MLIKTIKVISVCLNTVFNKGLSKFVGIVSKTHVFSSQEDPEKDSIHLLYGN